MKQTPEKDKYIGRRLDGRYLVEELVGIGGMAYVYRATDLKDNSTVAVKILKEELLDNEELVRRFKNESRAISMLDHENIVKILDVNFSDSVQYIVMEYLNGITLKEYITAHTSLTWKETVYFSEQLLRALQHAHDRGIIHRDMKPQNVMLLRSGKIKVTDFGIARFSRSGIHTITDKAIGTVHYISPEQAKGEETNTQSDIYSVGVMMYEMCTGKLPFDSDSAVTVALKQISDTPKRPREINPVIPEGLEDIILKAMEKDTAKRYPSAGSMLMDIENFKNNPSIRFEYKYLSSDNPTVYLDKTNDAGVSEERTITNENKKEQRMARDSRTTSKTRKSEPVKKRKRPHTINLPLALLMGITAACMIGAAILVYMTLNLSGSQLFANHIDVELPDFIGKELRSVQSNASYASFKFEVVEEYNTQYASGVIFGQTPSPPKEVKDNANIVLYVSKGTQIVTVPNLVGETYGNAVKELQDLGLVVRRETDNSREYNSNTITRTEPAAGASVESGTVVTIWVNAPNTLTSQYVPRVVGMDLATAQATLAASGLTVGSITEQASTEPAGTVIAQGIGEGTRVAYRTAISLVVSTGITEKELKITVRLPYADKKGNKTFTVEFYVGSELIGTVNGKSKGKASIKRSGIEDESITVKISGKTYQVLTAKYQDGEVVLVSQTDGWPTEEQHEHTWNKGKVTKEPTCTKAGTKTYTCTVCKETKTEEIPALGHDWSGWTTVKEPTCTAAGSKTRTCSRCGKTGEEEIPALGHDFHDGTCTRCGEPDPSYTPPEPEPEPGGDGGNSLAGMILHMLELVLHDE